MSAGGSEFARQPPMARCWCSRHGVARDWGSAHFLLDSTASIEFPRVGASGALAMLNTKLSTKSPRASAKAMRVDPAKGHREEREGDARVELARLDLVRAAEFELQANVLAKTREKLDALASGACRDGTASFRRRRRRSLVPRLGGVSGTIP